MLPTSATTHVPGSQKSSLVLLLSFIIICVFAWFRQDVFLFSWDNSILLHETQKLLNGGTYVNNFFETTPSMILYLYIPPLIFSKFFSLPLFEVFRAYIFLLAFFSLYICHSLLKEIFSKRDNYLRQFFFLVLAASFLILPLFELGQRDHLLIIFAMPYIFAITLRAENKFISFNQAVTIGLLAGLGFAIKPFFVLMPALLEIFLALHKRSLRVWLRPEALTILSVLILYTVTSLYLHADYYNILVPYAMRLYYDGVASAWHRILLHPLGVFVYLASAYFLTQYNTLANYKIFGTVLFIAFVGYSSICLLQRHLFYYHVLPLLTIFFLLEILLFYRLSKMQLSPVRITMLAFWAGAFAAFSSFGLPVIVIMMPFMGVVPWIYFACIFLLSGLLFKSHKNWQTLVVSTILVLGAGYLFLFLSHYVIPAFSFFGRHRFAEIVILQMLLFTVSADNLRNGKLSILVLILLLFYSLFYPVFTCYQKYLNNLSYKSNTAPIVAYMKKYMQNHTVYLFGTDSRYVFPLIDYAGVTSDSRFPFFWMIQGLAVQSQRLPSDVHYLDYIKDRDFLINMVTEDLNAHKPDFVIVEINKFQEGILSKLEYIDYFSVSKDFQAAWKSYHYVTSLDGVAVISRLTYHLEIYERTRLPNNL